jgi:hypothetical protein
MNPPFSQTAGRMGDKKELLTGRPAHRRGAEMLAPGGRLVAIVGRRHDARRPTYRRLVPEVVRQKQVQPPANVGVAATSTRSTARSSAPASW